ncbi:chromosome segregation protein SMC, partial [Streptomyces bambusae]|nr:chromosome segregation protein SMC [Streptomyces bambusae]
MPVVELVHGDAGLRKALAWVLRDFVVVPTLAEAEEIAAAGGATVAVTGDGDVLGAHLAHGGSAGAPSLLEVQAAVDEAARELAGLDVRCAELAGVRADAETRRRDCADRVEELAQRLRAAEKARTGVAQQLGRLAGQAKGAAGEAERSAAAAAKAEDALEQARTEVEECAERLAAAEEDAPLGDGGAEEPDHSVRDRLAADGANARQTEMEARLQLRTHEERVKGLAGRADGLDRAARAEREARVGALLNSWRVRGSCAVG